MDKNLKGEEKCADLEGGTFNVEILTIDERLLFEVRAATDDTDLRGKDFDNSLVDHLAEEDHYHP